MGPNDALQLPEAPSAHKDQLTAVQMEPGRADGLKTQGLGGPDEGLQADQKDSTTNPCIDTTGDKDRKAEKGRDMIGSESMVSLGFVDDDFIRKLVPS